MAVRMSSKRHGGHGKLRYMSVHTGIPHWRNKTRKTEMVRKYESGEMEDQSQSEKRLDEDPTWS